MFGGRFILSLLVCKALFVTFMLIHLVDVLAKTFLWIVEKVRTALSEDPMKIGFQSFSLRLFSEDDISAMTGRGREARLTLHK